MTIAHPALAGDRDDTGRSGWRNRAYRRLTSVGTRIDIVSDAICPWCYIGKRHLERALATLAEDGLTFQVHWNPFQLNPDMPREGRDRAVLSRLEIWQRLKSRSPRPKDHRGRRQRRAGVPHRPDDPHPEHDRCPPDDLVRWPTRKPGRCDGGDVQGLFHRRPRYRRAWSAGRLCRRGGTARQAVIDFLVGDLARKEVRAADRAAREAGVSGVPSFFLDGYSLFSGAMPAETIASALRQGAQFCCEQQAGDRR